MHLQLCRIWICYLSFAWTDADIVREPSWRLSRAGRCYKDRVGRNLAMTLEIYASQGFIKSYNTDIVSWRQSSKNLNIWTFSSLVVGRRFWINCHWCCPVQRPKPSVGEGHDSWWRRRWWLHCDVWDGKPNANIMKTSKYFDNRYFIYCLLLLSGVIKSNWYKIPNLSCARLCYYNDLCVARQPASQRVDCGWVLHWID